MIDWTTDDMLADTQTALPAIDTEHLRRVEHSFSVTMCSTIGCSNAPTLGTIWSGQWYDLTGLIPLCLACREAIREEE